jgi:hypothetical protein
MPNWKIGEIRYCMGIDADAICLAASGSMATVLYVGRDGNYTVSRVVEQLGN